MRPLTRLTRPLSLGFGLGLGLLAGCSSSASSRPLPERYDRPTRNAEDLLLASFELGEGRGHVLEVVGTPEVQSVVLHASPAGGEPSFAGHEPHLPLPPHLSPPDPPERRWLVEVRYQGQDPVVVAAVDVRPGGLFLHGEGGCTGNRVLALGPPGFDPANGGRASVVHDLEAGRQQVRDWQERVRRAGVAPKRPEAGGQGPAASGKPSANVR